MKMKCIVGLGNPGKMYEKTRHNVGFRVIDALIKRDNLKTQKKFKSEIVQTTLNNMPVLLVKPQTFMNLSGEAVRLVMDFYKLEIKDILIIYDDLDLPVGQFRLREKGSAGGHNGMKSLIQHFGTQEFPRLRIGIDKNPLILRPDYVLGKFSKEDEKILVSSIEKAVNCCEDFTRINFVDLMTKYNTKE
jgi:peptidyl-tRNA hydrolase, PTH1 family